MDDFTPYGESSTEALKNLEKVLEICKQTHISFSTIKCHMMMMKGIVSRHLLSVAGIWVDPARVEVILKFPTPKTLTQVHNFICYVS